MAVHSPAQADAGAHPRRDGDGRRRRGFSADLPAPLAPELLSTEAVAALLSVTAWTVRRNWRAWQQASRFPAPRQLGRLLRWDRRRLEAWLGRGNPGAAPATDWTAIAAARGRQLDDGERA